MIARFPLTHILVFYVEFTIVEFGPVLVMNHFMNRVDEIFHLAWRCSLRRIEKIPLTIF
jgi:hypothetical protein